MTQEQLDGIANVQYGGATGTLTWETATDWDNAVSEAGVVHEAYGDLPGAGTVQLGYPSFDRGGSSLLGYYPHHEDSGNTLNEVSGNGVDGLIEGGTLGVSGGLHNNTRFTLDGVDDYNSGVAGQAVNADWTIIWVAFLDNPQDSGYDIAYSDGEVGSRFGIANQSNGEIQEYYTGSNNFSGLTVTDSNIHHFAVRNDDSALETAFYLDATKATASFSGYQATTSVNDAYHWSNQGNSPWDGGVFGQWYFTRALSDAEIQAHYDALTGGHLETATKSYGAGAKPDLQNLSYALNGQTIDLKVIGSPGTASEEVVTQTLGGATSYTLSWADSHSDFRLRPEFTTTDETVSPTFSRGEVVA